MSPFVFSRHSGNGGVVDNESFGLGAMPEQTLVEAFIARGPEQLARCITLLKDFFEVAERRAALRLAVVGVIEITGDKLQWENTNRAFEQLFSIDIRNQLPDGPLQFNQKTIRRFALGTHYNRDRRLEAFLALHIIHQVELRPDLVSRRALLTEAFSVGNTLERVRQFIRSGDSAVLSPHTSGYDVRALLTTAHEALGTNDSTIKDFLYGGTAELRPVSSYVMYRYSTRRGEIVKSFLTILSPEINKVGSFSFVNVYGSGDERSRRISRGVVVGFQRCIYFLAGGGMIVEKTEGISPYVRGLKAFAIPHEAFAPDHRLLTGLVLSNSLSWNPIVARFAMIHIGFSSRLHEITDQDVRVRFLTDGAELKNDVSEVIEMFNLGNPEYADRAFSYVVKKINNCPAVDLKSSDGVLRALTIEEGREPLD